MHTIIVTFTLTDMTDERYRKVCDELAPAFAELPGLLTKVWLADPAEARYGGIYLFADVAAHRFTVDEATTRRTQPGLVLVGPAPATV